MMEWWIKDVYCLILKHKWKASDIAVRNGSHIILAELINIAPGAITLQEWIDGLQDE